MILSFLNHVSRTATSVSASSTDSAFSPENLKHPHVRRRHRAALGVSTYSLIFDFASVLQIGVLALVQPKDAGGMASSTEALGWMTTTDTVRHRLDAVTAGAGALLDTGVINGNWRKGYGIHTYVLSAPVNARYWKVDINAPSLAGASARLDIGLAWAGAAWSPSVNLDYGWGLTVGDTSAVSVAPRSALEQVDVGWAQRTATFALNALTETEAKSDLLEMQRIAGLHGQVLFIPNPLGAFRASESLIGRMTEVSPILQPNYAQYQTTFSLRESL